MINSSLYVIQSVNNNKGNKIDVLYRINETIEFIESFFFEFFNPYNYYLYNYNQTFISVIYEYYKDICKWIKKNNIENFLLNS